MVKFLIEMKLEQNVKYLHYQGYQPTTRKKEPKLNNKCFFLNQRMFQTSIIYKLRFLFWSTIIHIDKEINTAENKKWSTDRSNT